MLLAALCADQWQIQRGNTRGKESEEDGRVWLIRPVCQDKFDDEWEAIEEEENNGQEEHPLAILQ